MATIVAQATGNWSAAGTWVGGVPPGVGDIAQSGPFTVTIDQDVTCDMLEATSSGHFMVTGATRNITANLRMTGTNTAGALQITAGPAGVTLTGNIDFLNTTASRTGVLLANNTNVTVNGNVNAGGGTNNHGISAPAAAGTAITVNGNVTGGSGGTAHGINHTVQNCVITVNGNVTGGSGSGANGITDTGTGTLTVNGNVTGGSSASTGGIGVNKTGNGTSTINGNVTGGSGSLAFGAANQNAGTMTVNGYVQGGAYGRGTTTGQSPGVFGISSGASRTYVREMRFGPNGLVPTWGSVFLLPGPWNRVEVRAGSENQVLQCIPAVGPMG